MPIRHTDALVVGGELAGAVAAALLARAHKKVVVLEQGEGMDGEVLAGLRVHPVDDLWPNLEVLPRAHVPVEALGMRQDVRRIMPAPPVCLQVLNPLHRLDLFVEPAHRVADLKREAGEDGERAATVLSEEDACQQAPLAVLDQVDPLVDDGFFAVRRARASYRDAFAQPSPPGVLRLGDSMDWLAQGLKAAVNFLSHSVEVPPAIAQRLLKSMLSGVHVAPEGGRNALRQLLLDVARKHGAEVVSEEAVAAVVVEGGRVTEVRLGGRTDALVPRVLIDATVARDLVERVSPEKHAKKLMLPLLAVAPHRVRVGVVWVVRSAGLPPGLGDRAILQAMGDGPGEGPALFGCQRQPASADLKKQAAGLGVLTASVMVTPAQMTKALEQLELRMRKLFPFTRRHLVESRSVGMTAPQMARLAVYGGPPDPMALGGRGVAGGLKGLLRAGRDVAPALGVEGELWAGHAVAVRAERALSQKRWFGAEKEASV